MRLFSLLLAVFLGIAPAARAAQQPSYPDASPPSSAEDRPQTETTLPVSIDRIRQELAKPPTVPLIRGLNEIPTFRSGVEERLTLEDFFKPEDFQVGPVPPGGIYAHEMQRAVSNPVSDPLAQPYAAFSGGQLATIALENLIFKYLGGRLARAFAERQSRAALAEAEAEVARAIADYCAAQPAGGAAIEICTNRAR
jgi:hypothetical protein